MISETSEPVVLTLKDIGASDAEVEKYGTIDAIRAIRQAEVDAINVKRAAALKIEQDKLAPRPSLASLIAEAETSTNVADRLGVYGIAVAESQETYEAQRTAEAKALAAPLLARAKDLVERLTAVKKLMKPRADALATVDILALRTADARQGQGRLVITNVDHACSLIVQARELAEALKDDTRDLSDAAKLVEQYIAGDVYDRGHSDPEMKIAPLAQAVMASIHALRVWIDRVAPTVTSIEDRAMPPSPWSRRSLGGSGRTRPAPETRAHRAAAHAARYGCDARGETVKTSFVDFDVREHPSTWLPRESAPRVTESGYGSKGISHTTYLPPIHDPKKPSPEVN